MNGSFAVALVSLALLMSNTLARAASPVWIPAFDNTSQLPSGFIDQRINCEILSLPILGLRFYSVGGAGSYVELAPHLGLGSTLQDHFNQPWTPTGFETDNYKMLSVETGSRLTTIYIADDHDIVDPLGGPFFRQTQYLGTAAGLITSGYTTAWYWLDHGTATYGIGGDFNPIVYRLDILAVPAPPAIQCPGSLVLECAGPAGAVATFAVTATDACDPGPLVVCAPPSGSAFSLGSTIVTCTATDANTNSSSCTFTVTVVDTTSPQLTCPPPIVVVQGEPITITPPTAIDNCDGVQDSLCVRSDGRGLGSDYPVGVTEITCVARYARLDTISCNFTVTVLPPNQPPTCVAGLTPQKCGVTFPLGTNLFAIAVKGDDVCLTLDSSRSSDPDGDALMTSWIIDTTNLVNGTVVTNCLDAGCHAITMVLSDGRDRCYQFLDLCVVTPSEAIEQCILLVESTQVDRKNKRPLLVTLKAAKVTFDSEGWRQGAEMLKVFQHKVRAQVFRANPEDASMFVQCAEDILDALECVIETPRQGDYGDH